MTKYEANMCEFLYTNLNELRFGNPDHGGHWWWWDSYAKKQDRECVRFWETLMLKLQQAGLPHALAYAVKYIVVLPYTVHYEDIPLIIDWLHQHPEYI